MVASAPPKQGDVPICSFSKPAGDDRHAVKGVSVEFPLGTCEVNLGGCPLAVELQSDVLRTKRVGVNATNRQGMSDDEGGQPLTGCQ